MHRLGGLWGVAPRLSFMFLVVTLAGIGMPGTSGFDALHLLIDGAAEAHHYGVALGLGLGTVLIAGVLLADLSAVDQNIAAFGLVVFPVVIMGGLDSVPGTIVGGLTIGLLKSYVSGYADAGLAEVIPYIVLTGVLMVRPYGIFGETRIERV